MSVPVQFDITIDQAAAETAWLPLNRWGSVTMRLTTTVTGNPTYSIVGTQKNVLRNGVTTTAADEIPLNGFDGLTAEANSTQDVAFRAIKLKISAGTGTVQLRAQSESTI